jgi:small subunit ribosomal protein S16
MGAKKKPHYRICVADSRARRDGKIVENIGHYCPNTPGKKSVINKERALHWLNTGAQPSQTVKQLFKKEGIEKNKKKLKTTENTP